MTKSKTTKKETLNMAEIVSTPEGLLGASVTSSVTVATGFLETINHFAPLIGLVFSAVSLILAVIFFMINRRQKIIKQEEYIKELKHTLKEEILTEMMKGKDDVSRDN